MTRSCKSSITVQWLCSGTGGTLASREFAGVHFTVSSTVTGPLGTSFLPCYASYPCILHEISSSVEIQHEDGWFSNYMFTYYQGMPRRSRNIPIWFDCCACTHRFPRTYGFSRCDMSEIRSGYVYMTAGLNSTRVEISRVFTRGGLESSVKNSTSRFPTTRTTF